MPHDVSLTCQCGDFQAVLHHASAKTCNHAICYCVDCQAFARHLGQADRVMDPSGGTELYQAQPYQLEVLSGQDKLAVLQLKAKGLYRWHTSCCNTPICNTLGTPKFSFVGLMVANVTSSKDALGPVLFHHKPEQALTPVDPPKSNILRFVLRTMRNALLSRINGKWKQTPFFDIATGRSMVKPHKLTEAEREAAYAVTAAT